MKKEKDNLAWKIDVLEAKLHGKEALTQSYRAKFAVANQERKNKGKSSQDDVQPELSAAERESLAKELYDLRTQLVARKVHTNVKFVQRAVKKAVGTEQLKLRKKLKAGDNSEEFQPKLNLLKSATVPELTQQIVVASIKSEIMEKEGVEGVGFAMLPAEWKTKVSNSSGEQTPAAALVAGNASVFGALNEMVTSIRIASGQVTRLQLKNSSIQPDDQEEKEFDSDVEDNSVAEEAADVVDPPTTEPQSAESESKYDGYISGSEDEHRPTKKRLRPPRHLRVKGVIPNKRPKKNDQDQSKWKYTPNAPPISTHTRTHPQSTTHSSSHNTTHTKLHPSWEASRRQKAPVKFEGKKKTFD